MMNHHSTKSTIGVIATSCIAGLVMLAGIGALTTHALARTITTHADHVYLQQATLSRDYQHHINAYNRDVAQVDALIKARMAAGKHVGIVLPQTSDGKTPRALEAAGEQYRQHLIVDHDGAIVYIIQPGDTLSTISAALGYSVDALANVNSIRNVNLIYAHSALRLPQH